VSEYGSRFPGLIEERGIIKLHIQNFVWERGGETDQGSLTEGEVSVQLTSLYSLV